MTTKTNVKPLAPPSNGDNGSNHLSSSASIAALSSCSALALLLTRRRMNSSSSSAQMHKRIVAGNSPLNNFVTNSMHAALARYSPTWWTNAHIQTFLPFLLPQPRVAFTRDVLELHDGGRACLDWAMDDASSSTATASSHDSTTNTTLSSGKPLLQDAPIALILHGLTGGSASMRTLCAAARTRGYRPVVFNKRGHGGLALATPKLQAFGCIDDLDVALDRIHAAFPHSRVYGIGYSAGAALLCSYLGETGDSSRIDAGVFLSPGYNTVELFCQDGGSKHRIVHRLYAFLMTFTLKKLLLTHRRALHDVVNIPKALQATSLRAFDQHVFVNMHGYEDHAAYWRDNDPMRALHNIARPLLCISALDDPVCTKDTIPYRAFESNPLAMLVVTGKGAHCAFYEGDSVFALESWANHATMLYIDQVRVFQCEQKKQEEEACGSDDIGGCAVKEEDGENDGEDVEALAVS